MSIFHILKKERASCSTLSGYLSMSFIAPLSSFILKKGEFTSAFLPLIAKFEALFKFCEAIALIAKSLHTLRVFVFAAFLYQGKSVQSFATFFCK